MSYIKPNKSKKTYNVMAMPTMTQGGYSAIHFIGDEIPNEYSDGFKYYDDEDTLISDFSSYAYFYSPNVYSVEEDEIVAPIPNNSQPSTAYVATDFTASILSGLKKQIEELEPYIETKPVYIDDTEVVFDKVKDGSISAILTIENMQKPCVYEVVEDKIIVAFEPLEEVGTVTLTIQ